MYPVLFSNSLHIYTPLSTLFLIIMLTFTRFIYLSLILLYIAVMIWLLYYLLVMRPILFNLCVSIVTGVGCSSSSFTRGRATVQEDGTIIGQHSTSHEHWWSDCPFWRCVCFCLSMYIQFCCIQCPRNIISTEFPSLCMVILG